MLQAYEDIAADITNPRPQGNSKLRIRHSARRFFGSTCLTLAAASNACAAYDQGRYDKLASNTQTGYRHQPLHWLRLVCSYVSPAFVIARETRMEKVFRAQ
jgi:hypothetical protein